MTYPYRVASPSLAGGTMQVSCTALPTILAVALLAACGSTDASTDPAEPADVASVTVAPSSAELTVGETVELEVTVLDQDGNELTDREVNWSSDNARVAGVDSDGTVTASGEGDATITAAAGDVEGTAHITVTAEAPGTGRIRVTTATTGQQLDPDGYTVRIDGGQGPPVGVNAAVTIPDVRAGSHEVRLAGVADNCTVAGGPARAVTVVADGTVTVDFDVTCEGGVQTGTIAVTTVTTGQSLDPDGYSVSVDGEAPQAIGVNATISIPDVPTGQHSVALNGVAANCSVTDGSTRTVTVVANSTAFVNFNVACAAVTEYPDVSGTYNVRGAFADVPGTTFSGTMTLSVPDPASGALTGTAEFTVSTGQTVTGLSDASITDEGAIQFTVGRTDQGTTWRFRGVIVGAPGQAFVGEHTLSDEDRSVSGPWGATRATASAAKRAAQGSTTSAELLQRLSALR